MERDDHLTFREIHCSEEELVTQMTRLETYLYEDNQSDDDFTLRFLTPCDRTAGYASDGTVHLRLTPLGEFDTCNDYVAVSYTWSQSPLLERVYGSIAPKYLVWSSDSTSRPLHCPPLVLHRALEFASTRMEMPLIWIDQECIIQTDPQDVEIHLERMHKVYYKTPYTVALLSQPIMDVYIYLLCHRFLLETIVLEDAYPAAKAPLAAAHFYKFLSWLTKDTWFKRLWTYNERNCCRKLCYAIVASLEVVDVLAAIAHEPHMSPALVPLLQTFAFFGENGRPRYACDFYIDSDSLNKLADGFEGYLDSEKRLGQHLGDASNTVREVCNILSENLTAGYNLQEQEHVTIDEQIDRLFSVLFHMSELQCSVLADRLTIVSNICSLRWRLRHTELDKPKVSFSTCALVLLAEMGALGVLQRREGAEDRVSDGYARNRLIAREVFDLDIIDFVHRLSDICFPRAEVRNQ